MYTETAPAIHRQTNGSPSAYIAQIIRRRKAEQAHPFCAYLYDLPALRQHVSQLITTLPDRCRLFYAIKANSELPLLQTLAPIIHGFEVASLGEVRKARTVLPHGPIIFGGPGKTDTEIIGAMQEGVELLHLESINELARVEQIGRLHNIVIPILLRVNLRGPLPAATLQMAGVPTQFGIDEAEVPNVIAQVGLCQHISLRGFHFHSLSNNLDPIAHAQLVAYYIHRAQRWAKDFDLQISMLNVGGGIGVNYRDLTAQFDWLHFVDQLTLIIQQHLPDSWQILFECGRYLTAACGYYAVEVLDIKHNHGKNYLIVRGGTHHFRLPVSWQHSHPCEVVAVDIWSYPFARPAISQQPVTIVGQLCTPKDVLARDIVLPQVRMGDVILFRYAGAYGWSISHHDFLSHPHPEHIFLEHTT